MASNWVVVLFCGEMGLSSTDLEGISHFRTSRLNILCSEQKPECLLPLSLSPLLHHHLALFRECSLSHVIVVTQKNGAEKVEKCIQEFLREGVREGGEGEQEGEKEKRERKNIKMKIEMELVSPESCAADTLLTIEHKIPSEFLIFNWDVLLSPSVVRSMIDSHRINSALFTSLVLSPPPPKLDPKGKPQAPPFSFDSLKIPNRTSVPSIHHYFALDQERLLHVTPFEAGGEEEGSLRFSISKVLLRNFPLITLNRSYLDCTFYICHSKIIQFIRENVDKMPRRSFQMDILPQLVHQQFSSPILQDKEEECGSAETLLREMTHSPPSHSRVKCFLFVATKESHGFIGRLTSPQGYADVCRELANGSVPLFAPVGTRTDTNAVIAADVTVGNKVQIGAESAVGVGSSIGDDVIIRRSIIGKRCKIGPKVKLMNTIVMDDVVIDGASSLTNVIVCDGATLIGATLTNCIVTTQAKLTNKKSEKEVIQ